MSILGKLGNIGVAALSSVIDEDFIDSHPVINEVVTSNADTIKKWFKFDKESAVAAVSKGVEGHDNVSSCGIIENPGIDMLHERLIISTSLMEMYRDVEEMDDYPEITVALDAYAEDATTPNTITGKTVWIESEEELLKRILEDLLHRRLRIEDDIYGMTRTLAKYGNLFAENIITEHGVVGLNFLDPPTVRRIENEKGALLGFIQDPSCQFKVPVKDMIKAFKSGRTDKRLNGCILFFPWEVTHWRLRNKRMRGEYGTSILDSSRWIWKRLVMLEDSALVYKLTKSPGRYAFFIDVGDTTPKEAAARIRDAKRAYQKKKLVNPTTGQIDFRYNPMSPHEDFYIPTRGGEDTTRIDVISGPDSQLMDDVDYFKQKLVTSLKVPRRYLGLDDESFGRAASQDDVRFGRAAMRVQREIRNGLRNIERVHLAALNIDPDRYKWETMMVVPSYIYEMGQIELMNSRADLANNLEAHMPQKWILKNVFKLSSEEADVLTAQKNAEEMADELRVARADAIADDAEKKDDDSGSGGIEELRRELAGLSSGGNNMLNVAMRNARRLDEVSSVLKRLEHNYASSRRESKSIGDKMLKSFNEEIKTKRARNKVYSKYMRQ